MAIHLDAYDQSLIVNGFENGIADSPFNGLADLKNVNIISVPGEASVSFATSTLTSTAVANGSVVSANVGAGTLQLASTVGIEPGVAIYFTATTITGISTNTVYWVYNMAGTNIQISPNYQRSGITSPGSNGTGTFSTYNMGQPKHMVTTGTGYYFLVDSIGQVWSNSFTTSPNYYWTYTGNKPNNYSNGNGLLYYEAGDATGYIFVFSNSSIDVSKTANSVIAWSYQWAPAAGTVGVWSATPANVLLSPGGIYSHEALVGQDNTAYYCDGSYIGSFFEIPGQIFSPTNIAKYTFNAAALSLPKVDKATCLAELGVNLLVGGQRNLIYPWDRVSTSYVYPLWLAESYTSKMLTINTNTYIFTGNRGRIYITNGSQAQLFRKIPDHISGTVEPYFTWGGVASTKNQIYFSVLAKTNSGTAIGTATTGYGGLWAIDLETQVIRLTNKLSYATYAGYATAIIPIIPNSGTPTNPLGYGLYIGWDDGSSGYGLDWTIDSPYTASQASIDSDLIPIGTYDKPRDFTRVEYRLTKPMVSGESVTVKYRLDFSQAWTTIFTDSTVGNFSNSQPVNFKNAQWLQLQVVLNSTASSPSYTRLKEVRIKGLM